MINDKRYICNLYLTILAPRLDLSHFLIIYISSLTTIKTEITCKFRNFFVTLRSKPRKSDVKHQNLGKESIFIIQFNKLFSNYDKSSN